MLPVVSFSYEEVKEGKGLVDSLRTSVIFGTGFKQNISFTSFYCCNTWIFKGHTPLQGEGVVIDASKHIQI